MRGGGTLDGRAARPAVAFLGEAAPLVLFTAAHSGQGGQGHINEQSRAYWIDRFEKHGMTYLRDHSYRLQEAPIRAPPATGGGFLRMS